MNDRLRTRARATFAVGALLALLPLQLACAQGLPRPLPQEAYVRLDSLERAALSEPTFAARLKAVSTITSISIGQGDCVRGPEPSALQYPGLVRRLAGIYRQSKDIELRNAILYRMPWMAECDEAAAFLGQVAEEAPTARAPSAGVFEDDLRTSAQAHAVSVLASLGPRGEATLRRLYGQGSVRDSAARATLETLSKQGFRRPR